MKKTLIFATCLAVASTVAAQKNATAPPTLASGSGTDHTGQTVIPATIITTSTFNGITETVVNVAGEQSWDLQGDPSNTILSLVIGPGEAVTGLGWDVECTTVGGSWLNEAQFAFGPNGGAVEVFLTPSPTGGPGTESNSSPVLVLADLGIPDIVCPDGTLLIELDETFDDASDAVDADWTAGGVTIQHTGGGGGGVPTVSQWGLMILTALLFGGVVWRSVSRKTATAS
jgi:uncharacterized protein YraI